MKRIFKNCAIALIASGVSATCFAEFDVKLQTQGFGTAGLSMTNASSVDFVDPITKQITTAIPTIEGISQNPFFTNDIKGGLRFNTAINDDIVFVVELYSQGQDNFYNVETDLLYVDWIFNQNWDMKVGRMRLPFFLFSEYKQVGYTYLWSRLPLEVYTNSGFTDFDGAMLRFQADLGAGWKTSNTLTGGNTAYNFQQAGMPFPVTLDRALLADFTLSNDIIKFNAAYAAGALAADLSATEFSLAKTVLTNPCAVFQQLVPAEMLLLSNPPFIDTCNMIIFNPLPAPASLTAVPDSSNGHLFNIKNANMQIMTFGYDFAWNHFISVAEWTKSVSHDPLLIDSIAWYATIGFEWEGFTPYITYSDYRTTNDEQRVITHSESSTYVNPFSFYGPMNPLPVPETLLTSVNSFLSLSNVAQSTIDAGIRYDIAPFMDIKFDYRYVVPRSGSAGLFDLPPGKRISWLTAVIDVVF